MRDPEAALEVHAREELGVDPDDLASPLRAALSLVRRLLRRRDASGAALVLRFRRWRDGRLVLIGLGGGAGRRHPDRPVVRTTGDSGRTAPGVHLVSRLRRDIRRGQLARRQRVIDVHRRHLAGAILAGFLVLAPTGPASAHSGSESTDYRLELGPTNGDWTGAELRPIGLGDRVEVERTAAAEVIVLGYADEPYLRLDAEGVWRNDRSPATYLNEDRFAQVELPATADAAAAPNWELLATGTTVSWHDHRTHRMSTGDPPGVQADADRQQVVVSDSIRLLIDARPVSIATTVVWVPPPSPWSWIAGALVVGLGGIAVAVFRRGALPLLGLVAALAATVAPTVGDRLAGGHPVGGGARRRRRRPAATRGWQRPRRSPGWSSPPRGSTYFIIR